jgi:hypothetical protein
MGEEVLGGGSVRFFVCVSYGEDGKNFALVWELITKLEKSLWEQNFGTKAQCSWGAMPCQTALNEKEAYIPPDQYAWFVEVECDLGSLLKIGRIIPEVINDIQTAGKLSLDLLPITHFSWEGDMKACLEDQEWVQLNEWLRTHSQVVVEADGCEKDKDGTLAVELRVHSRDLPAVMTLMEDNELCPAQGFILSSQFVGQYAPEILDYSEFCPNFWRAVVEAWGVKNGHHH